MMKVLHNYIGIKNNKIVTSYMFVTKNFSNASRGRIDIKDGYIWGCPPYPKIFLDEYGKWYIKYQLTCNLLK